MITRQQFDEINGKFGVGRGDRFSVIPLGIDLAALQAAPGDRERVRAEMGASDAEVVVGFVGRLTEIKNIPLFLQAAAKAIEKSGGGQRLRFVIIGDGHLRATLESEAASLGIAARVCFLGNRQDIGAVYAGLDIVALTSLNEGTPLSLIEAMAAGKPVISTGVGGVVDLLGSVVDEKDGFAVCERGIRVDVHDAEKYGSGLINLAQNEQLRLELALRGQKFVENEYGKERLINDIKALYRQLVAG